MTKPTQYLCILLLCCGLVVTACNGSDDSTNADPDTGNMADVVEEIPDATTDVADTGDPFPDAEAFDEANAMGHGGHPLLPWPADQYMRGQGDALELVPDGSLLPKGFVPSLVAGSGASRVTPIVTYLPGGIDPRSLPDADDWGASLEDTSSIRVVVLRSGEEPELWPVLAEIDTTISNRTTSTLIIRPHRPFPAGAQVAVGLRTSLRTYGCYAVDQDGGDSFDSETYPCLDHEPSAALQRVLDDAPVTRAEASWRGRGRDALIAALPLLGPHASELAQAWTFTVRGRDEVVEPLIRMQAIAHEADTSSFTLEPVRYEDNYALVYGTIEVPWFLDEDDRVVVDTSGEPLVQEVRAVPFLVTIPRTVTEPRPVVLFGHGFFSSIEEPTWGNLFGGLSRWQMAAVTTRFHGFAEADLDKAVAALSGPTLEGMVGIIDLQRQSQANFTVVHNLIRDHLASNLTVDFGEGEFGPLDASNIPYMGISNGGTQGLVMMATSPALTRGALIVPGGGWAHMLQRAAQWRSLGFVFSRRFASTAELQVGVAMLQQLFDPVDSLNYAEHLVHDRLPGLPHDPQLLIVEAVNDSQVANMVTRWVAGAAQIPLLIPSAADVWGVPTIEGPGPQDAAQGLGYEVYDLGVPDNPPGNIAATENGVHDDVRLLDTYREQLGYFLEDGHVIRTCEGACLSE